MKRIKKCKAKGLYIFEGRVSANSTYFENKSECKKFLIYANHYLKEVLTIHEFVLTRHGWHMLVRVKHKSKIITFAEGNIKGAKNQKIEVWRVVSEQIRLFLSTYVRVVNKFRGRTGVLVHSSYKRFYFEHVAEAQEHINKMREQLLDLSQRNKKYRGKRSHWEITIMQGKASIFLCSKYIDKALKKAVKFLESTVFKGSQDLVLLKLIKNTSNTHNSPSNPPPPT